MNRVRLTDKLVGSLPAADGYSRTVWDSEVIGFGVWLARDGRRNYILYTDVFVVGRNCWAKTTATVAVWPGTPVEAARAIARECLVLANRKENFHLMLRRIRAEEDISYHLRELERNAAKRAAAKGTKYTLPDGYAEKLFAAQRGRCALTGLCMELNNEESTFRRPWAPSLDRIDSTKGYVKNNVRLVCVAANYAKGQWPESVFRTLVIAAARNPFL
jgi:hypothetical protein